jgi:hypothetical protein
MKFHYLAMFPFVAAVMPALILLGIADTELRDIALRSEIETVKILGLVGCIAAGKAFEPGEYLRRAWFLQGSCYGLLLLRDLLFSVWLQRNSPDLAIQSFEAALILIANAGAVSGIWYLSRAWQVAGIELPGSPAKIGMVRYLGVAVALAVAGPSVAFDLQAVANGNIRSLVGAASAIGDIFSLALIAPVMLTAIALRGGLLKWPWGLMTASQMGWLFYDATRLMTHFVHIDPFYATLTSEIFRTFACTFGFAAGIAQRMVTSPDAAPALRPETAS